MADTNDTYHVVVSTTEAAATPRALKTILEAGLGYSLPGRLAVSVTIQNQSTNPLYMLSDSAAPQTGIVIQPNDTRQYPVAGAFRHDLGSMLVSVTTDSDQFAIEVTLE